MRAPPRTCLLEIPNIIVEDDDYFTLPRKIMERYNKANPQRPQGLLGFHRVRFLSFKIRRKR